MGKEYEHAETIEDDPKTPKNAMARRPPHNYVAILKDADEPIDPFSEEVCEQLYIGVLLNNKKKASAFAYIALVIFLYYFVTHGNII